MHEVKCYGFHVPETGKWAETESLSAEMARIEIADRLDVRERELRRGIPDKLVTER